MFARKTDAVLSVESPVSDHDYRWFSSVGDLVGYTRAQATLTPSDVDAGSIVVVERDQADGTSWATASAEVIP